MTHRISYTTPKGRVKNNILIEAVSREEAEAEFFREFPGMVAVSIPCLTP